MHPTTDRPKFDGSQRASRSKKKRCETLEAEALAQCSVVPVYEAIAQFAGSKAGCEKTYRSSPEFRLVRLSYHLHPFAKNKWYRLLADIFCKFAG